LRLENDVDGALRLELQAFDARPDWLPTAAGLVQSYAALQRWEDVVEWAERAIALEPPESTVPIVVLEVTVLPRLRLAEAELALGRPERARRAFHAASELVPDAAALQTRRARFAQALDEGAWSEALRDVRAAMAPYDETMRSALRGLTLSVPR
jgi:tetratricopeptide (TPR) repeat protein